MKFLFVIVFFLGIQSFGQDTIPAKNLDKKHPTTFDEQMLYYYQGQLFTGVAIKGNAPNYTSITHYQAGIQHGTHVSYYKNGQLKEKTNYQSGRREGKSLMYYENGTPMMSMTYKGGIPCDTTQSWYEDGQLKSWEVITPGKDYVDIATLYYKNGNKQYEVRPTYYKQWYENGKIREEGSLINNVKTGKIKYYSEAGKLVKIEWYENGEIVKTKEKK